jgi:carboxylesterase
MNNATDIIYVVHGSNAHTWWRRLANRGYPWWRRWSLFCCAVRAAFGVECEIREFRWSGKNTHQARISAGAALARVIGNDNPERRVHLIGHSHGGNVALVAVNNLPGHRVESVIALANPNMVWIDSTGQPPEWLYWGDAAERVARLWNIYSPEDFVQDKIAGWFHGIPKSGHKGLLTRQRYTGTDHKPVTNIEIPWWQRRSAHTNMHSEAVGKCVGALLGGKAPAEAFENAGLSTTLMNTTRDRGGSPGLERTFKTLQSLSDPVPFDIGDPGARVGILFVHGFTASPSEMRPMAEFVSKARRWRCKAVLLPGHGTSIQDMQQSGARDWVPAVERAYDGLAQDCDHVFLVGLSLGATLCVHAALQRLRDPKLRGLLLLAPAFGLTRPRAVVIHLLRPVHILVSKGRRAADYFLDNRLYTYLQLPLSLAAKLMDLGGSAARSIGKLRDFPVMILAGDRESTVSLSTIISVARENPWIRLVRLARSRHILTVEPDKEILFETSIRFMEECLEKSKCIFTS